MSPTRSSSGPTYTQLGSIPTRPGVWGQWQGPAGESQSSVPISNVPQVGHHPAGQHPQELSDMLQMLGHSEQASYEDISMFNSFPE